MSTMMELLKEICHLRLAPVSEDADRASQILYEALPFTVHEYRSGMEYNGWTVPQKWKPVKAEMLKDGKLIYDGMEHPLGVVGYSTSFSGTVSREELQKHLFFHPNFPNALVYHCDYFYKQWLKDWGLSVPYNFYKSLEAGNYEVDIQTVFEGGTMKVLDYCLEGDSKDTIILNAHNCHAAQANDDIAGVVIAIEIIKRLAERQKRKYS